jgi:hypothetical protein
MRTVAMAEAATQGLTDLREHLRQAIAAWHDMRAVQAKAAKAVVRAEKLVAEAEARLTSLASLDEKIATHHAHVIRSSETAPSLELPSELAEQRTQRQQAIENIATAKAALALLEEELQQSTRAATRAEAAAGTAADAILREAADALADKLAEARAKSVGARRSAACAGCAAAARSWRQPKRGAPCQPPCHGCPASGSAPGSAAFRQPRKSCCCAGLAPLSLGLDGRSCRRLRLISRR